MRRKGKVFMVSVLVIFGLFAWSQVFASEKTEHQSPSVELGVLGQVNPSHFTPSIGVYSLFFMEESFEVHTSVWTNPLKPMDVGGGTGTLHRLTGRVWLGWEISAELEHDGVLYGLGPILEVEVVQHRLHTFLKVPIEYGHEFGWATIAGLTVAIWH